MKHKLLALVCALALALSLAGCTLSTPDSVGTLGDIEISSGLYLLAQYDAYQQAAQLAGEEQDSTNVKAYLKQTVTPDGETGEPVLGSDYVADKTLESLQYYAAVEARFEELGGELTDEQAALADSYAQQLMDQYGDTYTANGIGLETLKRYERILYKSSLLLELVYDREDEAAVSDAELTDHLENNMYMMGYAIIPLYNTSTFAFADEEQAAQMLEMARDLAEAFNGAPERQGTARELPSIYEILDADYDEDQDGIQTNLMSSSTLDSAFTEAGAADALRGLRCGEAAAIQYTSYAILVGVRLEPLEITSLSEVRDDVLSDLKSEELSDSLRAYGAQLADGLDRSAMKKLAASKITVN